MKKITVQNFSDALETIDGRYLQEAESYTHARHIYRWVALAACLALAVGLLWFLRPLPVYDEAWLSAQDAAGVIQVNGTQGVATKAYTEVYAPDVDALYLTPLPQAEYATIYRYTPLPAETNQKVFDAFIDELLPRAETALGLWLPIEEIQESSSGLSTYPAKDRYYYFTMNISQNKGREQPWGESAYQRFFFYYREKDAFLLNGKTVTMDYRQSDEEILASLEAVKADLFALCGEEFEAVQIRRDYSRDGTADLPSSVTVTWYQPTDVPATGNSLQLSLRYESDGSPDLIKVQYIRYRQPVEKAYKAKANCRLLTLEEAEALLYKGYVFGGHSCHICMQEQEAVDFEGYDAVGFEYVSGTDYVLPFYTFYQYLHTTEGGLKVYAKTYVCAIELEGLEEYFAQQAENHSG